MITINIKMQNQYSSLLAHYDPSSFNNLKFTIKV